jgi:hypothetical protein
MNKRKNVAWRKHRVKQKKLGTRRKQAAGGGSQSAAQRASS